MVKMTDAEVLFNDVTNFRDGLIPRFFIIGKFRARDGFSHDAIFNFIEAKGGGEENSSRPILTSRSSTSSLFKFANCAFKLEVLDFGYMNEREMPTA